MTERRGRTGAVRYVGDVVDASTDCLRQVGGCVEEMLDRADGLRGSVSRVARCVLRPGTGGGAGESTVQEQLDELRAQVADLAERRDATCGAAPDGMTDGATDPE
ncbi:MAG: hypothetical protein HOW97_19970 [Catenulispora sp.]|nr:hypothetical protein [Catenulispora sp.]